MQFWEKTIKPIWEKYNQLIKYIFIGGCTTLVNFSSFFVLVRICSVEENLSNAISIIAAVIFAYVTNKFFVFESKCANVQQHVSEAAAFFSSRAATMLIEFGGVFLLSSVLEMNEFIAKAIASVVVIILNYILSKFFVFKKDKEVTDEQ